MATQTMRVLVRKPRTIAEAVEMAEVELNTLKSWLSRDPRTPHALETGHRLLALAESMIRLGHRR